MKVLSRYLAAGAGPRLGLVEPSLVCDPTVEDDLSHSNGERYEFESYEYGSVPLHSRSRDIMIYW